MIISAVALVKDEVDIIETTLRHLFLNGIDRIYILDASTDGTREVYWRLTSEGYYLRVFANVDPIFHQANLTNTLIKRAGAGGADWVLPFDADEFFYVNGPASIKEALTTSTVDVFRAKVYRQVDWDHKWPQPERLGKMVFKWNPRVEIAMGNHSVNIDQSADDVLGVREIKYRSYEHFCSKIANGLATMDPNLPVNQATHIRQFANADEAEMRAAWEAILAEPVVFDPVPSPLPGLL